MTIARFPSLVIDCPDPGALATFYGAMSDWKVDISSGWAEIRAEYGQCISFQQVDRYTLPVWPTEQVPQQMHLDVIVDDFDTAEAAVLELGATKHPDQPGRAEGLGSRPSVGEVAATRREAVQRLPHSTQRVR